MSGRDSAVSSIRFNAACVLISNLNATIVPTAMMLMPIGRDSTYLEATSQHVAIPHLRQPHQASRSPIVATRSSTESRSGASKE